MKTSLLTVLGLSATYTVATKLSYDYDPTKPVWHTDSVTFTGGYRFCSADHKSGDNSYWRCPKEEPICAGHVSNVSWGGCGKYKTLAWDKSFELKGNWLCNGADHGCTVYGKLNQGDGDCDSDSDCKEGRCGRKNCWLGSGSPYGSNDDCCAWSS